MDSNLSTQEFSLKRELMSAPTAPNAAYLAKGKSASIHIIHRLLLIGVATLGIFLLLTVPVYAEITSTPTGDLFTPRTGHTATMLNDGTVLVVGGNLSGGAATAELYRPATGEWLQVGAEGQQPRSGHTAALLPNGNVLIVGGYLADTPLASTERYDPNSQQWQTMGNLNIARDEHSMSILSDGAVLVIGGYSPEGDALSSAEVYDPATGIWTLIENALTTPRYDHTSTVLPGDKVLIVGGLTDDSEKGEIALATTETYDHVSKSWGASGSLNVARYSHTAAPQLNGGAFVAGGRDASGRLSSTERYDPSSGSWISMAPLNTARSGHTVSLSADGGILVIGGLDSSNRLAQNEYYRMSENIWTSTGDLKIARNGHSASVLNATTILVAGGSATSGETLTSVELYTPGIGTDLVDELSIDDKTNEQAPPEQPAQPEERSFAYSNFVPFIAR